MPRHLFALVLVAFLWFGAAVRAEDAGAARATASGPARGGVLRTDRGGDPLPGLGHRGQLPGGSPRAQRRPPVRPAGPEMRRLGERAGAVAVARRFRRGVRRGRAAAVMRLLLRQLP